MKTKEEKKQEIKDLIKSLERFQRDRIFLLMDELRFTTHKGKSKEIQEDLDKFMRFESLMKCRLERLIDEL